MNQLLEWFSRIFQSWKFWIVIAPWDVGVRIRLGRNAVALGPGPHLRIPFLDEITMVNTRLRVFTTPPVTVSGSVASKTRTITVAVGYRIQAPTMALQHYAEPSQAIGAFAQAAITTKPDDLTPLRLETALRNEFHSRGIGIDFVYFVENVEIRTYRLLQGGGGVYCGQSPPSTPGFATHY